MKRWKRAIAIFLAGMIMGSTVSPLLCFADATNIGFPETKIGTDTKQKNDVKGTSYIITTKNKNAAQTLTDKYNELPDSAIGQINGELVEHGVLVADLTEKEVQKLEKEKSVLSVEKDITFEGSALKAKSTKVSKNKNISNMKKITTGKKNHFYTKKQSSHKNKKNSAKPTYKNAGKDFNWNMKIIHAAGEGVAKQKIKIAILDSGVDYLDNIQVAEQINLIPGQEDFTTMYTDETGHGTAVAGIIAGKTRQGETATGINPEVELYSAKILDENNQAPLSRIIQGIHWAMEKDVQIINMSFGTPQYSLALENAIKEAADKGILIIAAAGNGGENNTAASDSAYNENTKNSIQSTGTVEYPAAFPEVLAVGSVNAQGSVSEFSAQGDPMELVAPGEAIRVTGAFGEDMVASGTSMAAPHVAAVATMLWAKDVTKSAEFIRTLLDESARSLGDADESGYGLVDYAYAEDIYRTVEKQMEADEVIEVPENDATIQVFDNSEDVEKLEENEGKVVKGSWRWGVHTRYLDDKNINLPAMKQGAVYPDKKESGVKDMHDYPDFHGYFQTTNAENVNYVASYHYMIKIAEEYGKGKDYTTASRSKGLPDTSYKAIRLGFKGMNKKIKSFSANKDRKAFVYGIAMHTATDVFSHSTLKYIPFKWTRITHAEPNKEADDPSFEPRRFTMAYRVQRNNIYRFQGKRKDVPVMHDFHAAGDTDGTYYYQGPQGPYYRAIRLEINADLAGVTNSTVLRHFSILSRNYSETPRKKK